MFVTQEEVMLGSQFIMPHSDQRDNFVRDEEQDKVRFVQIKRRKLKRKDKKIILLQILDITDTILFDQTQSQNLQLSKINTILSQELEAPKTLIQDQNKDRRLQYSKIRQLLTTNF